jgi:hypothetical protein
MSGSAFAVRLPAGISTARGWRWPTGAGHAASVALVSDRIASCAPAGSAGLARNDNADAIESTACLRRGLSGPDDQGGRLWEAIHQEAHPKRNIGLAFAPPTNSAPAKFSGVALDDQGSFVGHQFCPAKGSVWSHNPSHTGSGIALQSPANGISPRS